MDSRDVNLGIFPLGSVESRAAARAKAQEMRNRQFGSPRYVRVVIHDKREVVFWMKLFSENFTRQGYCGAQYELTGEEIDVAQWAK